MVKNFQWKITIMRDIMDWTDDTHSQTSNQGNEIFSTKIITQVLTFFGQNLRRM